MAAKKVKGWRSGRREGRSRMVQMTLYPEQLFADGYRVALLFCMATCCMVFAFDCLLPVPGMRG